MAKAKAKTAKQQLAQELFEGGPLKKLFQAVSWSSTELKKKLDAGMTAKQAIASVKAAGKAKFGADWSKLWAILLPILMRLLEQWLNPT